MSSNRSPWIVIGPIIGFILVYVIIRFGVTEFRADMEQLGEFGVATLHEVQHAGTVEEIDAASEGDSTADEQAEDADTAVDEAATEDQAEEENSDETAIEEPAAEEPATEESAAETEEDASTENATTEEPAADEESTSHD